MIVAETQQIIATNDFDGTAPLSSAVSRNHRGELVYDPAAAGGKFLLSVAEGRDPYEYYEMRRVVGVRIILGGQSAWSLSISDGTNDFVWKSGTTETVLLVDDTEPLIILPREWLKLETTSASTAMKATVLFELYKRTDS